MPWLYGQKPQQLAEVKNDLARGNTTAELCRLNTNSLDLNSVCTSSSSLKICYFCSDASRDLKILSQPDEFQHPHSGVQLPNWINIRKVTKRLMSANSCYLGKIPTRKGTNCLYLHHFCFVFYLFIKVGRCEKQLDVRHMCRELHRFYMPAGHYNLRVLMALFFTLTERENSILQQRQHMAFCSVNGSGPLSIIN